MLVKTLDKWEANEYVNMGVNYAAVDLNFVSLLE